MANLYNGLELYYIYTLKVTVVRRALVGIVSS